MKMIMNKENELITSEREYLDYIEEKCGLAIRQKIEIGEIEEVEKVDDSIRELEMIADEYHYLITDTMTSLEKLAENLQKNTKAKTLNILEKIIENISNNA